MAVKIAGYSEGMTHADFTARMAASGTKVPIKKSSPLDASAPLWLIDEVGQVAQDIDNKTPRKMGKAFSNIYRANEIKPGLNINFRAVVTRYGGIAWAKAMDAVHRDIITWCMCTGMIPIDKQNAGYAWTHDPDSINRFLCVEWFPAAKECSLSEGYDGWVRTKIHSMRKEISEYEVALTAIGIDKVLII